MQIQISWLLLPKPTDLDLHCLQKQGISGFSRTRFKFYTNLVRQAEEDYGLAVLDNKEERLTLQLYITFLYVV